MEIKAQHRNARMSARKLRLVRSIVRGLPVAQAEAQLQFLPGHAADIVLQVLKSAVANADHNYFITADKLKVADLVVDEALKIKRFKAGSRGTAKPIRKHTAHVTVIVEEIGEATTKKRKVRKTEIKTITPSDFVKQAVEMKESEKEKETEEVGAIKGETAAHPSKANAVFQINKMKQQGGDAKKTHRRKSISGE